MRLRYILTYLTEIMIETKMKIDTKLMLEMIMMIMPKMEIGLR